MIFSYEEISTRRRSYRQLETAQDLGRDIKLLLNTVRIDKC